MKVLIFDTETTGLPKTKIICQETLSNWPHIVQFSFAVYDTDTNNINSTSDYIVRMQDNIQIPEDSSKIHGITNEISREKGTSIEYVLQQFFNQLSEVDMLVGHNVSFDINICTVELMRTIYKESSTNEVVSNAKSYLYLLANYKKIYCTMQESIDLCAIKRLNRSGEEYNKFPTLSELHEKLFGTTPKNLHNSLIDILITLRCFMQLKWKKDLLEDCNEYIQIMQSLEVY
jgi:DNA polymerase-3 subunit alpha